QSGPSKLDMARGNKDYARKLANNCDLLQWGSEGNAEDRVCGSVEECEETVKELILTLWFVLAVATAWACEVQPLFSPYDKVDDAIHARLGQANKSVHCSLYGITNLRLANDLIAAKQRGADVGVGLDKKQAAGQHDLHDKLQASGILVEIKPVNVLE